MKIKVNEIPKEPKKCLFAKLNCEYGWVCQLRRKRCLNTSDCNFLEVVLDGEDK